ncbi:uncharacterized protein B0H18DRAFT_958220 [Fomitopsis serialis]|uniref:uncharacterized protein n=1 Tax=Fomitopsis serialis TaxID=139415 RepID=UPI00200888D0|nr:uncharacterized protein B0H18DRAFT_958220 [Neoantrodia serialis]KAH9917787.1 hypothetical protein B0H18DRAFT_958220 [Neoantrodia serialis]
MITQDSSAAAGQEQWYNHTCHWVKAVWQYWHSYQGSTKFSGKECPYNITFGLVKHRIECHRLVYINAFAEFQISDSQTTQLALTHPNLLGRGPWLAVQSHWFRHIECSIMSNITIEQETVCEEHILTLRLAHGIIIAFAQYSSNAYSMVMVSRHKSHEHKGFQPL